MVGKRYKSGTKICVFEKSCWQHRKPSPCDWLGAAEDTATSVLRTNRGGHAGRAQVREPVIMVGATASGPSCKKIGRRDLSRGERKARRTYAWFRLAGYVRRRADATCNHRGGATEHIRLLRARLANARFCLMLIRDKRLRYKSWKHDLALKS